MLIEKTIERNSKLLKEKEYPGRGIIIGKTSDSTHLVQIYWIMGRSENSKNRIFIQEKESVKTDLFDKSKSSDTSLIIYNPIKQINDFHIVSNGDQTETIYQFIKDGKTFEDAINNREFEPDPPNYTPRISGLIYKDKNEYKYKLSIIKSFFNDLSCCQRFIYNYSNFINGVGHCITTYIDNNDPLLSFKGEPFIVKLFDNIEENCHYYWNLLNQEMLISMCIKFINIKNKNIDIYIKNKNKALM
ncbi:MAG: IMP cyclohydrolase [Candidatus Woesebacteria bacterium]|nr:IMP cyclohydrolase [Candidatus Woesebacteria bacterium]